MKRVHYTAPYLLNPQHRISVNVIGVGGTGSQVLTHLARINEGLISLNHPGLHVTAFDNDIVTEANIGRQAFSPVDLGVNKAVCLTSRINRYFGNDWNAVPSIYNGAPANITISCVDTAAGRIEISKLLKVKSEKGIHPYEQKYYWLDFGNSRDTGQVILGTIGTIKQPKSEQYQPIGLLKDVVKYFPQLKRIKEADQGPSCSLAEAINKQDLFINSTLSNLGCNLIWKLFTNGRTEYQGVFLNVNNLSTNPIKV